MNDRTNRIDLCLNCTLPICNENSSGCLYRISGREVRNAAQQRFYQIHRKAEIERVMEWQRANPDKVAVTQKRYRRRKKASKRRAYFREYYLKRKARGC